MRKPSSRQKGKMMETFEWICVVLSAFIMGIFTGYFTLHSIKDWIDLEREWKAMKGKNVK